MPPPTNLPDFSGLTTDLAAEFGAEFRRGSLPEDAFLGRLDDDPHMDIHAGVHRHISAAGHRNALHDALARLARSSKALRVVTTNYDQFLSEAFAAEGVALEEYAAPALPMGDDFEGMVYLHGSVKQKPRHLIVTDKDFGRAYLSDAWAARFLERMFSEYVVCFVGFSHNDVVLSYLARGLRPRSRRYAFTYEGDAASARWSSLGITPIPYAEAENHKQLLTCLQKWADWAGSGLIDRHQFITQMAGTSPSGIPDEDDFLESALQDTVLAASFCALARGWEWIEWISGREVFISLVEQSNVELRSNHNLLANWFAANYATSDEHALRALVLLRRSPQRPSHLLWRAICYELSNVAERRHWVTAWLLWLLDTHDPDIHQEREDLAALLAHSNALMPHDILLILEELLKPRPRTAVGFAGESVVYDVEVSDLWLGEIRRLHFGADVSLAMALAILPVLESTFETIWQRNYLVKGSDIDSWSYRRLAIEDRGHDSNNETSDFLIDLARDCLKAILNARHASVDVILDRWIASNAPLLRRLAVYGWTYRADVNDQAKMRWLLARSLLFAADLRHEIFVLLQESLPQLDSLASDNLVEAALHGPQAEDQPYHHYDVLRILILITRVVPNNTRANQAIGELKKAHPELPDFGDADMVGDPGSITAGFSTPEDEAPWTEQELHDLINADAEEASQIISEYQGQSGSFASPSWWGARHRISSVVSRWPEDGFRLWEHIRNDNATLQAVLEGWAGAPKDTPLTEKILQALAALDLGDHGSGVARVLAPRASNQSPGPPWYESSRARDLAVEAWDHLAAEEDGDSDPLFVAINSPSGKLAEFWISVISHDWREQREDWKGFEGQTRNAMSKMIECQSLINHYAWPIFFSRLRFLFSADPQWTKTNILPLLSWDTSILAPKAWSVLLQSDSVNSDLLEAGLKEGLILTAQRADYLSEGGKRMLGQLLSSVVVHSLWSAESKLQWLLKLTTASSPETSASWISMVIRQLKDATPELLDRSWSDWMRPYLEARSEGLPRTATPIEAAALAEWVDVLLKPDDINRAVQLACRNPAGFTNLGLRLRKMTDDRLRLAPLAFARLLAHLLQHTLPPQYVGHDLERIYRTLLAAGARAADLSTIREESLRIGIRTAPDWPNPHS